MINSNAPRPVIFFDRPVLETQDDDEASYRISNPAGLQKLVEAFAADGRFAPSSIVFQSGDSATAARFASLGSFPNVIVAPAGISDAIAALISALVDQNAKKEGNLVLIPATMIIENCDTFIQTIFSADENARKTGKSVLFCRRAGLGSESIVFETGGPDRWSRLLTVSDVGSPQDTDRFGVAMEMGQLYETCGLSIASSRVLVEAARYSMAAMYSACTSSVAVAERKDNVIFPNVGFLNLVKGQSITELLMAAPTKLLLDPTGGLMRFEPQTSTDEEAAECADLKKILQNTGDQKTNNWGSEKVLLNHEGIKIIHLTVECGMKIACDAHQSLTVNWSIIAGKAFIKSGSDLKTADVGETFRISPDNEYSATNIGETELIIYETRIPTPASPAQKQAS